MSAFLLEETTCIPLRNTGPDAEALVRRQVTKILQMHDQWPELVDRRCDRREPFPYPIRLTPINQNGFPEIEETIVVLGKHLSERGLDFYYKAPVPYRQVITSWECADGQWIGLLLDLRWCRSNGHGWYENGGRFLRAVDSPFAQHNELAALQPSKFEA